MELRDARTGPSAPATTDSIAGSVAPALDRAGVSTSSTPRAAKNARTAASIAARRRSVSIDAPRS
jgi:hypothetical protein